ncbi:MAG: hypothetical protein L6Q45_17385, partial [Anaerolineales bacterium]|nr:hypothetical protein [Anaerolineales bacterium]
MKVFREGLEVVADRRQRLEIRVEMDETGAISCAIEGFNIKIRMMEQSPGRFEDPVLQQGNVFAGIAVLVRSFGELDC